MKTNTCKRINTFIFYLEDILKVVKLNEIQSGKIDDMSKFIEEYPFNCSFDEAVLELKGNFEDFDIEIKKVFTNRNHFQWTFYVNRILSNMRKAYDSLLKIKKYDEDIFNKFAPNIIKNNENTIDSYIKYFRKWYTTNALKYDSVYATWGSCHYHIKTVEELLEVAENLDWTCNIYEEENQKRKYVEMQKYSPAGEDFYITVYFNDENPIESFFEYLKTCYECFDPDEHAEMWVESRGKNGVPKTIRELINDADAIKEMIGELYRTLKEADIVINKNIK